MAKRVLVFTNHYYPEHFKINEAVEWLIDAGHQVHVVTGWPNYPKGKIFKGYGLFKKSSEQKGNLSIRRLPLVPRGDASKIRLTINYVSYFISAILYTLFLMLFKKKYNMLLVHHTSPFFIAIPAVLYKKTRGAKAVLWDLDLWPQTLEAVGMITASFWLNTIEKGVKMVYKNFDSVLIGSKSFQKIALERVPHKHVFYFPNWAEKVLEENNTAQNFKTDLDQDALKIMYTGNLGEAQDFETLCRVIKHNSEKKIQWIFIGEGRFKAKMETLLSTEVENKKVLFIPQQKLEAIPAWVKQTDYVYLSLNDSKLFTQTVPAKLQGYMAMGKPVLAMLAGEGAAIIYEAKCGFTASPGNFEDLNALLKKAVNTSATERIQLGEQGKDYYHKNFSTEIRKKQLIDLIKE